jgi:hypothetical protein
MLIILLLGGALRPTRVQHHELAQRCQFAELSPNHASPPQTSYLASPRAKRRRGVVIDKWPGVFESAKAPRRPFDRSLGLHTNLVQPDRTPSRRQLRRCAHSNRHRLRLPHKFFMAM